MPKTDFRLYMDAVRKSAGVPSFGRECARAMAYMIGGVILLRALTNFEFVPDTNSEVNGLIIGSIGGLVVLSVLDYITGRRAMWRAAYSMHAELSEKVDERAKRKAIREQLGAFIKEGALLSARSGENPPPVAEHNEWVDRIMSYLRDNLDDSYAVRFNDFSGLTFAAGSRLAMSIDGRLRRLQEFLRELGSV